MLLTYFNSKETKGKMPVSPFNDLTFEFNSIDVKDLSTMYRYMVKYFILNIPIKESLRTTRKKSSLKNICPDQFEYVILDINDITNKEYQIKILQHFKNYKCIIGESRSNNGIDNFNLKGILKIYPLKLNNVKILVDQIRDEIRDYGTLDTSVSNIGSVSAPINRYNILLESNGYEYVYSYRFIESPKNIQIDLKNINNPKSLSELCLQVFLGMGFKAIKSNGACINFEHDTEEYKGGYYWISDSPFIMHHHNELDNINIYSTVIKLPQFKELSKNEVNYSECLNTFKLNMHIHKLNQKFIEVNDDIKQLIVKFLNEKDTIFAIKSPMGSSKSSVIMTIIEEAKEMDMRILICTNRISIANDSKEKYNLKIYNKDKYYSNDSFIVQYDSLHKYNIKKFDLVIFDEFISLLLHSRNNVNNITQNLLMFFACFKKKIVIADAFLTGYENLFVKEKKMMYLIDNDYRDDTKLYNYSDFNFFVRSILIHSKNHKLTISCTSNKIMFALKMLLEKNGLKVFTLVSDTPAVLKNEIYERFKNNEPFYDVLIFSPTLTVGVSNLNDIDLHFHYDCSSSCDVISSLQMIKRTRKAKEIHFYVKNHTNFLKTTYNQIKDDYIQNLGKYNDYSFFFEYNDYGEMTLSNLGKKSIQIDVFKNILEFNHKNAFLYLLKYQFSEEPTEINDRFYDNILLPYIRKVSDDEKQFMNECLDEYLNLSEFDKNMILDNKKENIFEILNNIQNFIKPETPIDIKNKILKICFTNNNFYDKILKYKIIFNYQIGILNKNNIQNIIANSLLNDVDNVTYWNTFLNFESKIEDEYSLKTVLSNNKLKTIIEGCGFVKKFDKGIFKYVLDDNIRSYMKYVKDTI